MRRVNLKALGPDRIVAFAVERGMPAYRGRQLSQWIYGHGVAAVDEITVLGKALREELSEAAYIGNLRLLKRLVSRDTTEKYLFGCEDAEAMEGVLIPGADGRLTLCVSSQAGCAMGCTFCLTGSGGFRRNLQAHEIADQLIQARLIAAPRRITNVVLMGMGEPLMNLAEVAQALWIMTGPMGMSPRRITLSTSGLPDRLLELPSVAPDVNIALSLNATTDEVRGRIMPVGRRHPIRTLLDALRRYPIKPRRRFTIEYVLLGGLNDTDEDARRLVKLLRGLPTKINLIPFNRFAGAQYHEPGDDRVFAFQRILVDAGMTAMIRKSMGQDILAACGQLRGSGQ